MTLMCLFSVEPLDYCVNHGDNIQDRKITRIFIDN